MKVVNVRDYPHGLPANTVRIDRTTPFGNPWRIGDDDMTRADVIAMFEAEARERLTIEPDWLEPLRGKDLACWCAPLPCHGDVIVRLLT